MAHISRTKITFKPASELSKEVSVRSNLIEQIQSAIDTAATQNASADFTAGLEVALAIITDTLDARPEELRNAKA